MHSTALTARRQANGFSPGAPPFQHIAPKGNSLPSNAGTVSAGYPSPKMVSGGSGIETRLQSRAGSWATVKSTLQGRAHSERKESSRQPHHHTSLSAPREILWATGGGQRRHTQQRGEQRQPTGAHRVDCTDAVRPHTASSGARGRDLWCVAHLAKLLGSENCTAL